MSMRREENRRKEAEEAAILEQLSDQIEFILRGKPKVLCLSSLGEAFARGLVLMTSGPDEAGELFDRFAPLVRRIAVNDWARIKASYKWASTDEGSA